MATEPLLGADASARSEPLVGDRLCDTQTNRSVWHRVRRDAVLLGGGSIAIALAQLGFRSILVVALVPSAYGRLSLILSLYNTVFLIGASGLPNSVARYISVSTPDQDRAIVRAAIRAGAWPTAAASLLTAVASALILRSPLAFFLSAAGVASLVYSLVATGMLRGRMRIVSASLVQPIAAAAELLPLAALWLLGGAVTPVSAFAIFCLGNVIGLAVGALWVVRTRPRTLGQSASRPTLARAPDSRQLLGFSMWLGLATVGIAVMPLVMRFAAAFDSYSLVAIIDVALVLLSIPQRVGTVIVQAVVPHATRALGEHGVALTISRRDHAVLVIPFVAAAAVLAFTPVVHDLFSAIHRPGYASGARYLALAVLAGPARILYGLAQGILVAHGDGRFLAWNSLSVTVLSAAVILVSAALGSTLVAFITFVVACWVVYLVALLRVLRLSATGDVG